VARVPYRKAEELIVKLGADEGLSPVAGEPGEDARRVHEEEEAVGAGEGGGTEMIGLGNMRHQRSKLKNAACRTVGSAERRSSPR
jgi:hypothetical protein